MPWARAAPRNRRRPISLTRLLPVRRWNRKPACRGSSCDETRDVSTAPAGRPRASASGMRTTRAVADATLLRRRLRRSEGSAPPASALTRSFAAELLAGGPARARFTRGAGRSFGQARFASLREQRSSHDTEATLLPAVWRRGRPPTSYVSPPFSFWVDSGCVVEPIAVRAV
jgi:hypothetical protein